ncbi:FUN14 domain-containing protein 2 [Varanus komodoensis]|uniref:FUN14 domain-containing protein 2 n=1 Tax=Varanus komodoensis TaxID=61221 RepID=UPI001CF7AF64|nr:FUN14 domain-containing protein 2 [Varanus komodoensis]
MEEQEEEPEKSPSRASGAHSCSSLIRLEQEAKRRKRAQLQQRKAAAAATIMPVRESSDDVLDLAEYAKNRSWWRKLFGPKSGSSAEKYSVATQIAIGGATGWCTGFIFQKIANHTGYIKIDWQMVERDVSKAKEQLKFRSSPTKKLTPEMKNKMDEVISFLKKNVILTGSFVGGFLLGMAS